MEIRIDRDIPVPITAQIKGQIEYGISYGTLERGSRLPNVRELARVLGVSPVTVSQAYQSLREQGIVTSAPGRGTFVSETLPEKVVTADRYAALDHTARRLAAQARELGVGPQELLRLVGQRLVADHAPQQLNLVFVGIYLGPSKHYVNAIQDYLGGADRIDVVTFDAVLEDDSSSTVLGRRDALLTFAHRVATLEEIAPPGIPIIGVPVIPASETRTALAAVDPMARVGIVAAFPEFLTVLKKGVATFAPHLAVTMASLAGTDELSTMCDACDVVVYASGSDLGLALPASDTRLIEYLHTPDPAFLVRTLAPRLAGMRARQDGVSDLARHAPPA